MGPIRLTRSIDTSPVQSFRDLGGPRAKR